MIEIGKFNQAGLADSKWSGIKDSLYRMIGFDPHSAPGVLRVAQAMSKISSSGLADEFCKVAIASTNGNTYWFSSESGKVWQRSAAGTITLVYTTVPTSGGAACLGAAEYQGVIYWFTENYVHKIAAASADGAAAWTANASANWQAFDNGDEDFHPAFELNQILYIGDGNLVAQINAGTFTPDALDVVAPLRVKALNKIGVDLLVGTYVADSITKTEIYRWNTYSDSWTVSDTIDEVGINAFLPADNYVFVQAGIAGNIYIYNGEKLELYKRIPGDYSPSKTSTVHPYAVANIGGQTLFGVSNLSGNPCDQGVYRLGRHSRIYPYIMDLPYPISERSDGEFVLSGIEIGAILVVGSDIMVSRKNGSSKGLDMLDWSTKLDGAFFESRVMFWLRDMFVTFTRFIVAYASLPDSTDITIAYNNNYSGYNDVAKTKDAMRSIVYSEAGVEATTLQLKVSVSTNGNDAPEIESSAVYVK